VENKKVREQFALIAEKYDFLNTLFSFGIDKRWRSLAIKNLGLQSGGRYLDFCAGTLPLSATMLKNVTIPIKVVACDFCGEMLLKGRLSCPQYVKDNHLEIIVGDAEQIPFKKNTYDGSVVCFGVRNLVDVEKGLTEVVRILKPGAKLVVLEFSNDINSFIKPFYRFYLEKIMPLVGGIISGNKGAYRYLAHSIKTFSQPEELKTQLIKVGFTHVYYTPLTFGIAYIHVGIKG
jgi:demethylmenaquinone methyltransferase/2-methoxy-6-polyprenyl-1,4-benzoquinol methylase